MKKFCLILFIVLSMVVVMGETVLSLSVNTKSSERMPYLFDNILYFVNSKYDIYQAQFSNGTLSNISAVKGEINTSANEISPFVIENNGLKIMYFARFNEKSDYDFYRAEFDSKFNEWRNVTKVEGLSTPSQEWSIWVSADEKKAYFTSKSAYDGVPSAGGLDIWYAENINGKWSNFKNIKEINTDQSEWEVFEAAGNLYFTSNKSDSFGGYDIYAMNLQTGEVSNIGSPVNSEKDERGFWTDGINVFFCSKDRPEGVGSYDLFFCQMQTKLFDKEQTVVKAKETVNTEVVKTPKTEIASFDFSKIIGTLIFGSIAAAILFITVIK